MWGDTVTNHACKTRGQVASTTLTTSANNNSSSNNNNNGNNRNTKKPEFYFSVSALPAWARRKKSRQDLLHIHDNNDFYKCFVFVTILNIDTRFQPVYQASYSLLGAIVLLDG
ncbi:unnamed protein product [Trichobilharzia regenti]|nr:unnamed protein product [Trichobilharzia regenti]